MFRNRGCDINTLTNQGCIMMPVKRFIFFKTYGSETNEMPSGYNP